MATTAAIRTTAEGRMLVFEVGKGWLEERWKIDGGEKKLSLDIDIELV